MNLLYNFILTAIFSCIAIIHIYWAFGGSWGKQQAIPTTATGEPLFLPGFISCFGVGAIFFSFIVLIYTGDSNYISQKMYRMLLGSVDNYRSAITVAAR